MVQMNLQRFKGTIGRLVSNIWPYQAIRLELQLSFRNNNTTTKHGAASHIFVLILQFDVGIHEARLYY